MIFRHFLWNRDAVFHPARLLGVSVLLHMLRIVRMIIDESHGAQTVKAFNKHSFRIKIGKTKRTDHLFHAASLAISDDSIKKSFGYL